MPDDHSPHAISTASLPWQSQPTPGGRQSATPRLVQGATAALVLLTLVVGFPAGRPGHIQAAEPSRSGITVLGATPEATPALTLPVIEQVWETTGGPTTPLGAPYGMAVAPDGTLWVVDGNNARFQIFAPDGTFRETWGTAGSGAGQFQFHPSGSGGYGDAVFDRQGTLYVADTGNHRVQKFDATRRFVLAWGSEGTGAGQFQDLISIAVGPDGSIYAADQTRNDVQRFDAEGRFRNTIGEPGNGEGQLNGAEAVAIDAAGTVWVCDYGTGRIERFAPDGRFLDTWTHDQGDDPLVSPDDLAIDTTGRVWVTDMERGDVHVFAPGGRLLTTFRHTRTDAQPVTGFVGLIGIAVGSDGQVYVGDWDGNVVTAFRVLPPGSSAGSASSASGRRTVLGLVLRWSRTVNAWL